MSKPLAALILLALLAQVEAQPPAEILLQQGRWDQAVAQLQQQTQPRGPKHYYNLGLCYQHLGDPAHARLNYQASLQRNPWNRALQRNLALLKSSLATPEPEEGWWEWMGQAAPAPVLVVLMLGLSWLACTLAWLYRRHPRERFLWGGLASASLALAAALFWCATLLQPRRAVVLPETTALVNGPGAEYSQSLSLNAGNLVQVLKEQGDWVEVAAQGRVRAWIRRDELLWVP